MYINLKNNLKYNGMLNKYATLLSFLALCSSNKYHGADLGVVSRGGLGGSVESPKLNVKTYNKHAVIRRLVVYPSQLLSVLRKPKMEVTLEQLNDFKLTLKTLEIAFQRP